MSERKAESFKPFSALHAEDIAAPDKIIKRKRKRKRVERRK
jgi:hypothetical protein